MWNANCYDSVNRILSRGREEPCAVAYGTVNMGKLWYEWEHNPPNALLNLKDILKATAVAVWTEVCSVVIPQ